MCSTLTPHSGHIAEDIWQATGCKRTFSVGCLRQIRGSIIILPAKLIIVAPLRGSHKEASSLNGNQLLPSCGSTAYVSILPTILLLLLIDSDVLAGSGKSILWYILLQLLFIGCSHVVDSSTIIEDVQGTCQTGLATFAIFYLDFREAAKQDPRGLLSSLAIQLSYQSDKFSQILSSLCSTHSNGFRQPSMNALKECLKNMLGLPGQGKLYIIVDALDECPNVSGYPTPREQVLKIVKELVDLRLPHVHFCITSRPELDIRYILEPLTIHNISLHEQSGQNQDIINYINSVIPSDPNMRRWREEDRRLVIETLSRRAGGM